MELIIMIQEYFLGGTSPEGFRSKFIGQIDRPGFYTYILKGGPGTGKSTLMKKAAKRFENHELSLYRCSSDINSLDAVVVEDEGVIIVDGTAPHVFEASYPGVSQEIIDLGHFWNGNELKAHSETIRYCFDENARYHKRVRSFIEALSALNTDIFCHARDCLDTLKLDAYADRLFKKLVKSTSRGRTGKIQFRQLSAFTTENYMTLPMRKEYCSYFLRDDFFAGSDRLLRILADKFTQSGYDVIVSECNMFRHTAFEHIIVPELDLFFTSGSFFNGQKPDSESIINFLRFYDRERFDIKKQRMNFNKKAVLELADEAASSLNTALKIHDELERYYINAIDFGKLGEMTENLLDRIENDMSKKD